MIALLKHNSLVLIFSALAISNVIAGLITGRVSIYHRQAVRHKEPVVFWAAVLVSAAVGTLGIAYSLLMPISDNVLVLCVAFILLVNAVAGLVAGKLVVPGTYTDSAEVVVASRTDDRLSYWLGVALSAVGAVWLILIVIQGRAASLFGG